MIEKNRNNFKMIGLLSKMSLTHKHPAGFTIGIFRGGTNKITDTALQAIGDLERGIEIGPNVVLRWWSQNDKSVMNLFSDPTEQLKNQLNLYVLEATLEKDREINPSEEYEIFRYLCDCIETVIFAFHLTKPGHIEANIKLGTGPDPGVFLSANHDYKINSTGFLFLGQNNTAYLLELNEIFAVKALAQKISSLDLKKMNIHVALDRFERSFYEEYPEDKLIDYMISFEALFVKKKDRSKSRPIQLGAAKLIGHSEKEKQEIMDIIKRAYDIRNSIVHGSIYDQQFPEEGLSSLCIQVEKILRDTIKESL